MRIGDDNLFEIGCRAFLSSLPSPRHVLFVFVSGVEAPSIGNANTISTRARLHYTVRLTSYCVIGAGCLVAPLEDEVLEDFTVSPSHNSPNYEISYNFPFFKIIYGPFSDRRIWSGRGKVQEMDLRRKHGDYLREMLPKFNRLRRGDNT